MLTLQIPMLLALLGTALMAVVIFAPSRVAAPVTISFAPPHTLAADPCARAEATWPALVDHRAANCDTTARLALVDALVAVRTAWADAILRHALDDDPDRSVRELVARHFRGGETESNELN
jgi:hypothetical protein